MLPFKRHKSAILRLDCKILPEGVDADFWPLRAFWSHLDVSAWCWGKDPKTGLQAVEVMASFKPFDGCVNGVAFDVYNEYQYVTYGLPEVLRKIRKGLKESLT